MQTFPTLFQLGAAQQVARLIDGSEATLLADLRASFWHTPTGGRFSVEHLEAGLRVLLKIGVLSEVDGSVHAVEGLDVFCEMSMEILCEYVFSEVLMTEAPLWLRTGMLGDGNFASEAVPGSVLRQLDALVGDPEQRDALLLQAGHKVDAKWRAEIGMVGELAVLEEIKHHYNAVGAKVLHETIQHVSLISDALGYDIVCKTVDGSRDRRLEVKTCGSLTPLRIFVSRNEIIRGASDSEWRLVICRLRGDSADVLGWTSAATVIRSMPVDSSSGHARWESASLVLDASELSAGLPLS